MIRVDHRSLPASLTVDERNSYLQPVRFIFHRQHATSCAQTVDPQSSPTSSVAVDLTDRILTVNELTAASNRPVFDSFATQRYLKKDES